MLFKKGFVLPFFCLAATATHSASKGSPPGEAESRDIARMWAEKDAARLGETPSILPGDGVAELTIWPNHWSGLGKLALELTLRVGDLLGVVVVRLTVTGATEFDGF